MTLHEAIEKVLVEAKSSLSTNEIASRLNDEGLYIRKDGSAVTSSQVAARVNNYKQTFIVENSGKVALARKYIRVFDNVFGRLYDLLVWSGVVDKHIKTLIFSCLYAAWQIKHIRENEDLIHSDIIEFFGTLLPKGVQLTADYEILREQLANFRTQFKSELIQNLINISEQLEEEEYFGELFNLALNTYTGFDNVGEGAQSTPVALSRLMGTFFDLPNRGQIFDPFAGYGSSLVEAYRHNVHKKPHAVAGDINSNSCFLGNLNLFANNFENFAYVQVDAYTGWKENMQADLIISNPPFNAKIPVTAFWDRGHLEKLVYEVFNNSINNHLDSQTAAVLLVLGHLKRNGKAMLVIPEGLVFGARKDYYLLRKYLVENRFVSGVVLLPSGAFKPYSGISTVALILDNSNQRNKLFLYDASSFSEDYFHNHYLEIKNAYDNELEVSNICQWLDFSALDSSTYDLSPKRFLANQVLGENIRPIEEISRSIRTGNVVPKANLNHRNGVPFIQIGNLVDLDGLNEIDDSVADYYISEIDEVSRNPRFLTNNSVLIAKVGSKLKATLYKGDGTALCNPNIIIINVDEKILSPEYLITQLQSEYVLNQVESIRHNIGVPHFSKGDFLSVKIKVIPLAEQAEYVAKYYGKKLTEEIIHSERQLDDELYNIIAALKHELHQPISAISTDIPSLSEFIQAKISNKELLDWNEPIVPLLPGEELKVNDPSILKNVVQRILTSADRARNTLLKAEQTLNIGRGVFVPETINLKGLLVSEIIPQYSLENCTINVKGHDVYLIGDKYQIEMLFRRLIENAIKHGFDEKRDATTNVINIRLKGKTNGKQYNEIVVENNGLPFPEDFNLYKFQTSGLTTNKKNGSGFGGFHIKRIIENHKGELNISGASEVDNSDFKVRFNIYLP